jgi:hypothetical protein
MYRHGRARPGHPRLETGQTPKDVDARHKAGMTEASKAENMIAQNNVVRKP